ncbi:MAG: invasion associated locus B family protein [Aestuariivita sp.]|nr:invasion associated locus B family protein [Aestuariivita sp.]MCY4202787.1 invasion associated locus B family protein [Aestuariivita sp.]MCY4289991.1 invasion associated locus B family protein [Aestuariivita sp.]MCY4345668.1 invasion associated locus B family protein [Aestuariivita sp.]
MGPIFLRVCLGLCLVATSFSTAIGQERSNNRVAANSDWSVFVESDPRQCWSVSAPKEILNQRDGRAVAVRRGTTQLMVHHFPSKSVAGQVAFTSGYPFAVGSTVELEIDGSKFVLIPGTEETESVHAEWAWPETEADDAKIIEAMKKGRTATVRGRSQRGTDTTDTFSLIGFTASHLEAEKRCRG